jgi:hypothetical protein
VDGPAHTADRRYVPEAAVDRGFSLNNTLAVSTGFIELISAAKSEQPGLEHAAVRAQNAIS